MKTKLPFIYTMKFLTMGVLLFIATSTIAQVTISKWKMNKGEGIINFTVPSHGDPSAYGQMSIPTTSDSKWEDAPVDGNGAINYSVRSILSNCLNQLDFTYFETFLNIPANFNVNDLNVTFSAADDGARAYIFNSAHPNGAFIGQIELNQAPVTANYASLAVSGEINRLVIAQFDSCPSGNNLTGAQVKVNGETAVINTGGCTQSNFFWSNEPVINGSIASGTINGIGYTYSSDVSFTTTTYLFGHSKFPSEYSVPDQTSIRNDYASNNKLTFAQPMTNPVLVFASIGGGQPSPTVSIQFQDNFSVVWAEAGTTTVDLNAKKVTGTEGNIIIRFDGTFTELNFNYLNAESWVNFAFGADFSTNYPDTEAPTIALNGNSTTTVDTFATYTDLGAVASDNCDDNPGVLVSGAVDTNVPGDYTLTYTAVDASGNTSGEVTRIVTVVTPCTPVSFANTNLYVQASTDATSCQATVNYGLSVSGTTPSVSYTFSGATEGSGSGTGSGQIFNKGITNVTVTATNSCGTNSTSFDITVVDDVKPIAKAKPVTLYLDANGEASLTAADVNDGSSDNCDIDTYTLDTSGTICATAAEGNNLTLTAPSGLVITSIDFASYGTPTGSCGNFAIGSCNASNSLSIVSSRAIGQNSVTIPASNSVFGDPCGGTVKRLYVQATYGVKGPSVVYDCNNLGTNTVNLIVTDTNGNVSTATANVTVIDNISPVLTAPEDINVIATSAQGALVNYATPVATDNCSATTTLTAGLADGATFPIGETVVTYTATDPSGNTTTESFKVTVSGVVPAIIVPENITQSNDEGVCGAIVNYTATETVGIPASVITYDIDPGSSFDLGTTTVTATATNAVGTSIKTFTVTVEDNELPKVETVDLQINLDENGNASITPEMINNSSSDNCGIASLSLNKESFSCANVGVNEVILTVTDVNGNSVEGTANVTIKDNTGPIIQTQNVSIDLDANGNASIASAPIAIGVFTEDFNNEIGGGNKTTLVDWDILSGNVDVADFITGNGSQELDLAGSENAIIRSKTAVNLTPGTYELSFDNRVNSNPRGGNSVVVSIGNVFSQVFASPNSAVNEKATFTVTSAENALITLEQLGVSDASGSFVGNFKIARIENSSYSVLVDATDNCGVANISVSQSEFSCANVGNNSVTLTVTDTNGNITSATAIVTVNDVTPATVITNNISVDLDANGNATITPEMINNGSFDNCGIATISLSKVEFSCANVGENQVILEVTDTSRNVSSATANVTVKDITAPTVAVKDITVNLDENGSASITPEMIDNGSSDACGIASLALDNQDFGCDNLGSNTVKLTVTDVNGNVSSATANVTVKDVIPPTVLTQNVSVTLANGEAFISTKDINAGTFDNCSFTLSLDKTRFTCNEIGDQTVTLIARDSSGNTSTQTAIVSVLGDIPTIDINDFYAVDTQKVNTIFLGFAESVNLTTAVTGGTGFTYEWTTSTGEVISNEANPSIMPEVSTTYNVTVTNSNGCSASTSLYVCVIDARGFDKKGRPNGKVVVCHHTNGKKGTKHVEIEISKNAVMQHLANHGVDTDHADKLGACNATCIDDTTTNTRYRAEETTNAFSLSDNLSVYPNPSLNGVFEVKITGLNLDTNILLFDTNGKLVERKLITKENVSDATITIGNLNLSSGLYVLRVITEEETIHKKIIVTKN